MALLLTERAAEPSVDVLKAKPASETILVIDPDPTICCLIDLILTKVGYTVISTECEKECLQLFRSHAVDMIITSMEMPDTTGLELVDRLTAVRPGTPAIFLAALRPEERVMRRLLSKGHGVLEKPFHIEELMVGVRSLLDRNGCAAAAAKGI